MAEARGSDVSTAVTVTLDVVKDPQPLLARRRIVVRTQEPETPRAIVVDEGVNGVVEGSVDGRPCLDCSPAGQETDRRPTAQSIDDSRLFSGLFRDSGSAVRRRATFPCDI